MFSWIKRPLGVFFMIILISGCSRNVMRKEAVTDPFKVSISNNEIYMFNIISHRLGVYDLEKKEWNALDKTSNLFQYSFENENRYYTCGHSFKNNYRILEVDGKNIKTIYQMKEDEKIFPMTHDKDKYYYLIQKYTDSGQVESKIVLFYQGAITDLLKNEQKICYSTLINDSLYYTVYKNEEDVYDLYEVDLGTKNIICKCIQKGLVSGEIFTYDKKLYVSDKTRIYNKENEYKKKMLNYFLGEKNLLFQIDVNKKGDLEYFVTNLKTKKVLNDVFDIVNFEIKNNMLVLFGDGEIRRIPLEGGRGVGENRD